MDSAMFRRLFRLLPLVSLVVSLAGSGWSGYADRLRWGIEPGQFYAALDGEPVFGTRSVLVAAHNAGNGGPSSSLAVAHGADIIEIDVISHNGKLYAAHNQLPGWLPSSVYNGPTLATAWKWTEGAKFVQLDLKETSTATLRQIYRFLESHKDDRRVMISSRDLRALEMTSEEAPDAIRLLSIGDQAGLDRLRDDPDSAHLVNGVTIRASLLDQDTIDWLHDQGLLVIAWTVNDLPTTNQMLALGVDAITTDNLAVLDALEHPTASLDHANWDLYVR
jgi:glycerophosphoryl diester phosphodiesterase